jgi:hypothetical protein
MDGRDKFGHGLLMWTRHASSVSKMVVCMRLLIVLVAGSSISTVSYEAYFDSLDPYHITCVLNRSVMCTVTWTAQQFPRCIYGILLTHWFQIISYQIRLHKGKKRQLCFANSLDRALRC